MKRLFIVLTLILLGALDNINAQVRQVNDVPLYEYVPGRLQGETAIFADTISQDSLRVFFNVRVTLAQPFCPGTKIDVKSVDLLKMWAVPIHEKMRFKPTTFELSKDDECRDEVYQDFWDRYKAYIKSWYKEEVAYEKIPLDQGMDAVLFVGVFRLIPEQPSTIE